MITLKSVHPARACCRTGIESGTRSISTKAERSIESVSYLHPEVVCSHLWLPCQRGVQGEAVQLHNCGNAQQQLVDLDSSWSTHLSEVVHLGQTSGAHVQASSLGHQEREASGLGNQSGAVSSQSQDSLCTHKRRKEADSPAVGRELRPGPPQSFQSLTSRTGQTTCTQPA